MGGMPYCTREMIMRATDAGDSALNHAQIDRSVESASRQIDDLCALRPGAFLPVTATRTFDWPAAGQGASRLWLDSDYLASASAVSAGGTTIESTDYFLRPDGDGPYNRLEIDLASSAAFSSGDTYQRSISITGVWCRTRVSEAPAGTLAAAISSTSATSVSVSAAASADLGVGSVIKVDDERMLVTERAAVDTTVNTGAALTASRADDAVSVADGTAFAAGEVIAVGTELMYVTTVVGNSLAVRRAWAGSTLAAHSSGADIYAYRTLTVERGALGTTAATHDDATAVYRNRVAGPVQSLAIAYALTGLLGESTGYGTEAGGGESRRSTAVAGLPALEARVIGAYRPKLRHRAV